METRTPAVVVMPNTRLALPSTSDADFDRLIASAREISVDATDVAALATRLADSGERLTWPSTAKIADVASTGGPGSLSTLVAPIALVAHGCQVVKLGVPGRPAGAIDVLATIPGYQIRLEARHVRGILATCGFAHFVADNKFAPLDAALYAHRRRVGAVDIPALAAASLLAKKTAVGVGAVGLDVRAGAHGNFGRTRDEARGNATLFCDAARILNISAVAFLTDAEAVPQPWIGRGESLVALAVALGVHSVERQSPWARSHFDDCLRMAAEIVSPGSGARDAITSPPHEAMRDVLVSHLAAQGSSFQAFIDRVSSVLSAPRETLHAPNSGTVRIDMATIRDSLVAAQSDGPATFADPGGVELLVKPGANVAADEPIALVRIEGDATDLLPSIKAAFHVLPKSTDRSSEQAAAMEILR
jgi:pyrimidine-nucleoside phosphorylase